MNIRISLLTLLLICVTSFALASTCDAVVVAPDSAKVTAPYSGTLTAFDYHTGDTVEENGLLFSYSTTPVYAPQGGKVVAVYASEGDDASGVLSRYGTLCILEPELPLYIAADTSQAYDKNSNKYLHAGETLYLKSGNEKGTGRVVSVSNNQYTVEILSGDYDPGDTVRCYRESGYSYDSETGRGKVYRYSDITISANGRVQSVYAAVGDSIHTGDLLFEMLDSQAPSDAETDIVSPVSGVLTTLPVSSGQQVSRGQLLCEITDLTHLELSCDMDEVDLPRVKVGDSLSYVFDAYPDRTLSGTVTKIYPMGTSRQNATYYDVRVTISTELILYPGMNATVTIP